MKKHLARWLSFVLIMSLLMPSAAFSEGATEEIPSGTAVIEETGDTDELIAATDVEGSVGESEQSLGDDGQDADNGLDALIDAPAPSADEAPSDDDSSEDDSSDTAESGEVGEAAESGEDGDAEIIAAIEDEAVTVSTEADDALLDDDPLDNGLSLEAEALAPETDEASETGLFSEYEADFSPITPLFEEEIYTPGQGDDDGAELLDAYVQQMFDDALGKPRQQMLFAAAPYLDEDAAVIYNLLSPAIVDIANGNTGSAAITIPFTTLEENGVDCGPWTASQLGVSQVVYIENNTANITQDAKDKMKAKINAMVRSAMSALLSDYPCELYWYDKTQGYNTSYGYTAELVNGEYGICFKGNLTISMSVSANYAGQSAYTVNAGEVRRAQQAIENAHAIVRSTSGKSVINCLTAYKNAICERVSYDHYAANRANNVVYGDPWQLVNVFDNDSNTNVVCEGYSKAFKYLFDLSCFGSGYDCILVTGTMGGGEGAGGHMWNLVRMEDGANYLVDVTNCDEGTIGEPDQLFMASGPSGQWNDYTFALNGANSISYTYDTYTLSTFSKDALTVSPTSYDAVQCYVVADAHPAGAGSVSGASTSYTSGLRVTLTATPANGYTFVYWLENDKVVSTDAAYTFTVEDDTYLMAVFKPVDPEGSIAISAANFKDAAFRAYLSTHYGTDYIEGVVVQDDVLTPAEIASIKYLDVSDEGISSLEGIGFFTELTELHCAKNNLTALDLTACTKLTYLDCADNRLETLDISKCATLATLNCPNNKLKALNISRLAKLQHVNSENNLLISVNADGCTSLEHFILDRNATLETASAKNCTALNSLTIDNSALSTLDVSGCTGMTMLFCRNDRLTDLNFSGCTSLTELYCENNLLTGLDVSRAPSLVEVYANENRLTSVNLSGCSNLKVLYTNGNTNLPSLDISDCPKLCDIVYDKYLSSAEDNTIFYSRNNGWQLIYDATTALILPDSTGIAIDAVHFPDANFRAYIAANFDKYDDQGNEVGANGYLSDDEISRVWSIDLYGDFDHENNTFHGMGIASLVGIQYFTSLTILQCGYNALGNLNVSDMTELVFLDCSHCTLTSLNVKGCTALATLECYGNALEALDIRSCTAILPACTAENRQVKYDRNDRDAYIRYRADAHVEFAFDFGTDVTPLTDTEAAGIPITAKNFPDEQFRKFISANIDRYSANGRPGADGELSERDIVETRYIRLNTNDGALAVTGMGIASLDGIRFFTALESLDCSCNPISALDVSGMAKLDTLYCSHCGLKSLNLKGCAGLKVLDCHDNALDEVDISDCALILPHLTEQNKEVWYDDDGTPSPGFRYAGNNTWILLRHDNGTTVITDGSAPQPAAHSITVAIADNGASGKVSAPATAAAGEVVEVTLTPDAGCVAEGIAVKRGSEAVQTAFANGKYTFTMPGDDVTLTATFRRIPRFTLRFDDNGTVTETRSLAEGDAYGALPVPAARSGYTFRRWVDGSGAAVTASTRMGAADATVYADWELRKYRLIVDCGPADLASATCPGATVDADARAIVFDINTPSFELPVYGQVKKEGVDYEFCGWYWPDDHRPQLRMTIDPATLIGQLGDGDSLTVKSEWNDQMSIAGTVNTDMSQEDPNSGIHGLDGMGADDRVSTDHENEAGDPRSSTLAESLKEIAIEKSKGNQVAFPEGDDITDKTVTVDMSVSTASAAINDTAKKQIEQKVAKPASENVTVRTDYLEITITQNASYTRKGSDKPVALPSTVLSDTGRVLEIPVRYNMSGRYDPHVFRSHMVSGKLVTTELTPLASRPQSTAEMKDGTYYISNQGANSVIYIYSREFSTFAVSTSDKALYEVKFESNGGSAVESVSVYDGEKLAAPGAPTRAATSAVEYSFDKWYTDQALTQPYNFDAPVKSSFTLYAGWTEKAVKKAEEPKPEPQPEPQPDPAPAVVAEQPAPSTPITIAKIPASVKAKAKKNRVTVSWKKIKKTKKTKALLNQIKGIEVQYSTDPNFVENAVTKAVGRKKTKVVLKLQKKTTYYVRVRYTDGAGGVSEWSAVKRVKTKK